MKQFKYIKRQKVKQNEAYYLHVNTRHLNSKPYRKRKLLSLVIQPVIPEFKEVKARWSRVPGQPSHMVRPCFQTFS